MPDHTAVGYVAIFFQAVFGAAYFILALGKGTGNDTDMERRGGAGRAPQ